MTSAARRILAPWHDDAKAERQDKRIAETKQRRYIVLAEADLIATRAETIARIVTRKPATA